ncbi:MAG TPA: ATP-binding protein [Opitutus sp.]|nr:ATP-binding protein [Opitutus sp.]
MPIVLGTLVLGFAAAAPAAERRALETGNPLMQAFAPDDYGAESQIASVVEDREGVLYFGSDDAVVSFDGTRWQAHPGPKPFYTLLALDREDRVWFASSKEIGRLAPQANGQRTLTLLHDRLPDAGAGFSRAQGLFALPQGLFLLSADRLLRWESDRFTLVSDSLDVPLQWDTPMPFVQKPGEPARYFDGARWHTLPAAPEFTQATLDGLIPLPDGSMLAATLDDALWLVRGDSVTRWPTEADAALRTRHFGAVTRLRDGTLVFALYSPNALLFLDAEGRFLHYLQSEPGGSQTFLTRSFLQTRSGDLWTARSVGMARIPWPAAITTFGPGEGLPRNTVRDICRYEGRIFVGNSNGLFALLPLNPARGRPATFESVPGCRQGVWRLLPLADSLAVAGLGGLRIVHQDGTVERPVTDEHSRTLLQPRGCPESLLLGGPAGMRLVTRDGDGSWRLSRTLVSTSIVDLRQDGAGDIWAGLSEGGLMRITGFDHDGVTPAQLNFRPMTSSQGTAESRFQGDTPLVDTGVGVLLVQDNRIMKFDRQLDRFVVWLDPAARFGAPTVAVHPDLRASVDGGVWIVISLRSDGVGLRGGAQIWHVDPTGRWKQLPSALIPAVGAGAKCFEEKDPDGHGSVLWTGGSDGLARVELPLAYVQPRSFGVVLRRFLNGPGESLPLAAPQGGWVFPSDERTLHFEFATDRLDDLAMSYQFRLGGVDERWSEPSRNAVREFVGLKSGHYNLQIQARDSDGRTSRITSLPFVILPPWWLAWWAFGLYGAAGAAATAGLVRWRNRASRRRNVELEQLVAVRTAEVREHERQLVEARDAADAANRAKSVFLASMSHELRTPLNAIMGYAQVLQRSPGLAADQRRQLETVHASGDHLLQLINDVLDLAKIEAGRIELLPQTFSLSRLLAHLTEIFEPRAAQKKIAFSLHGETPLPDTVVADEARLRQVLYNLLGNAIKFTERGRVELRVGAAGRHVRFTVVDTGIGIAPAERSAIFELFHQAAGPGFSAEGSGLGLAISQRLVRLMGGEIIVESTPGVGSRFSFELPFPPASAAAPATASDRIPAGYRGARRRILIVDDEPVNRDVLRTLLTPLGFAVEETDDGQAAVDLVATRPPDLVLMDLRLRQLDGLTATRRIRTQPGAAAVRIIAISASVFPVDRAQALEAGCDEFEPKPIRATALLAAIRRVLGLEWEWSADPAAASPAPLPDDLPDTWPLPPLAVLHALDAHTELGDLAALRAQLAVARAAAPSAVAFLDALASFAANAKLASLRRWITQALARASSPNP